MTGLQKQIVTLNFGQGVDQKTDSKLVVPGKLLELQNGVFKKGGSISKRNGYRILSKITSDDETVTAGDSLASFNDELLMFSGQKLYTYSDTLSKWVDKGDAVSVILNSKQVIKNTSSQTISDSAVVNGIGVYAWEDSRGGVRASVFDETTGAPIVADTSLDASASRPRCIAFAQYLFVFYYKSGKLYARRLSPYTPSAFDIAVELSDTVNTTDPTYDVVVSTPTTAYFAHNVQGASEIKVGAITSEPAISATVTPITISDSGTNCIGLVNGPTGTLYVAYHNATNGLRCVILNRGLATLHSAFTLDSTTSPIICNVTGYQTRGGAGCTFFYEVYNASTHKHYIKTNTASTAGTAGTASVLIRSLGLASKAWTYYGDNDDNDRAYFCAVHESTLQSTYFIVRNDGLVIGKSQPGLASGLRTRPILANVSAQTSSVFSFSVQNKTKIVSENATLYSLNGVTRLKVDFTSEHVYNYAQLGGNLHIVGGVLSIYDGQNVVEHGFHLYPENLSAATSGAAGVNNGTYNYVGVYEWTDNQGQIHKSSPSPPVSVTVSGGPKNVDVTFPTLRVTSKKSPRTNVSLVLYRTEGEGGTAGAIYYRVSSLSSPTLNDTTADSVTITDTLTDTSLISREILYTTGGILENIGPPAASTICVYRNRLILAGLENENEAWYSKARVSGEPVQFSDAFTVNVEAEGGGITAVWPLDEKLLFFKKNRFYYITGDGPPDTGDTNFYGEPELVSTDTGCSTFNSLATLPGGVIRKTSKGIYAVNSQLQDAYIGANVEDFNSKSITSATLVPNLNQIRFTTSDGPALVYDYFFKQWGTFSGHASNDAIVWKNDSFVFLRSNGQALVEDSASFKDAGAAAPLKLTTAWISMAGVLGFQRVYRLAMLAEYKSPHTLIVRVGYDFSNAWEQTIVFSPETGLDVNLYGDGATYGDLTPYGGPNGSYKLRSRLTKQKCQSIRFQIEELITSATEGTQEGLVITSIALEIGLKQGIAKMRSAQTVAAQTGGT